MFVSIPVVSANELGYDIDYVELVAYRDGLVHVTQTLKVNETFPAINVELIASAIENVIVVDENSLLLDYEIEEFNMTVFSLGARRIVIEYDTIMLTQKEAGVWTLTLYVPCNLTVKLPNESTIVYLNEMPTAIMTEDNRAVLDLFLGSWEISYVLPVVRTSPSPVRTPTPFPISLGYLVGAFVLAALIGVFFLLRRRGPPRAESILKLHPELRAEDRNVIQFMAQKGGKVLEAEIRERFPELSRTSIWRLVKRLEKMEIVVVKRVGLQNQIELKNR